MEIVTDHSRTFTTTNIKYHFQRYQTWENPTVRSWNGETGNDDFTATELTFCLQWWISQGYF